MDPCESFHIPNVSPLIYSAFVFNLSPVWYVCQAVEISGRFLKLFCPSDLMLSWLHQEDLRSSPHLTALPSHCTHPNANICSKLSQPLRKGKRDFAVWSQKYWKMSPHLNSSPAKYLLSLQESSSFDDLFCDLWTFVSSLLANIAVLFAVWTKANMPEM